MPTCFERGWRGARPGASGHGGAHRLDRRPLSRAAPRGPAPRGPGGLGGHPSRHLRLRRLLPRQQPPADRSAQRLRVLHPGDRCPHPALAVRIPPCERARTTVPACEGMAISHQPSPWMGDRNQFVLMPLHGDRRPTPRRRPARSASTMPRRPRGPDLYEVALDGGIALRLAPTDHGAICEIELPAEAGTRICCSRASTSTSASMQPAPCSTAGCAPGSTPRPREGYDPRRGGHPDVRAGRGGSRTASPVAARPGRTTGSVLTFAAGHANA